jgi:hypothetical protein
VSRLFRQRLPLAFGFDEDPALAQDGEAEIRETFLLLRKSTCPEKNHSGLYGNVTRLAEVSDATLRRGDCSAFYFLFESSLSTSELEYNTDSFGTLPPCALAYGLFEREL